MVDEHFAAAYTKADNGKTDNSPDIKTTLLLGLVVAINLAMTIA